MLRPFVYFNRPKSMDLGAFIEANPTLGEIQDNFNMQQKRERTKQYDPIFDLHELTKNYDLAGVGPYNVVNYVHYICAVLNLYTHLCLSANLKAINLVIGAGIDESHILCCLAPDTSRSTIHEKLKQ